MPSTLPRRLSPLHHEPVHGVAATRAIESLAQAQHPPGTLMERAGMATARLLRAWQPHARHIDVVCGPGNNGGDGLVAATELHRHALAQGHGRVRAWLLHMPGHALPTDAARALEAARAAGVNLHLLASMPASGWPWEHDTDAVVDGLLGIGLRPLEPGLLRSAAESLAASARPVLCIDTPSGLDAETGHWPGVPPQATGPRLTLSLLTLKPGLLTGHGRDLAGEVWLDPLGVDPGHDSTASAWWGGYAPAAGDKSGDPHAAHKGSYGDVAVVAGQSLAHTGQGMAGAAALAARAALHAGAGRVYLGVSDAPTSPEWDPSQPELMLRHARALLDPDLLTRLTVVAGCGGGSAVAHGLPQIFRYAAQLVLDADGLNAVASDPALQTALGDRGSHRTVITPHPLEAARLLASTTAEVMADRPGAARELAERLQVVCVLKGAGTVVAAPGVLPWINGTGNPRLATAGTGDVLAGMLAAAVARRPHQLVDQVRRAVHLHGALADAWASHETLTAAALARQARPV